MTVLVRAGRRCMGLIISGSLLGCAALADPPENAVPPRPSVSAAQTASRIESVVLPVVNATGRPLRLPPDLHLGLFEPLLTPNDSMEFTIPELIQAGFILGLQKEGQNPAPLGWTNQRVPDAPSSVEGAWRLASDKQLARQVVWIKVTNWDDLVWRQRAIIRLSGEVVVFEPGRADSLRTRTFQQHPFVIPQLSTLAQAAGHIGMRMASMMFP